MSANSRRYVIVTPFTKVDVLAGICKIHGLDVWVVPSKQGAMVVHDLPVPVFEDWDISELLGNEPQADDIVPVEDEESLVDSTEPDNVAESGDTEADPGTDSRTGTPAGSAPIETHDDSSIESGNDRSDAPSGSDDSEDHAEETVGALSAEDKEGVARALAKLSRAGVVLLTSELGEDVGLEEGVSGIVTALVYDSEGNATDTPAGLIVATGEDILEDLLLGNRSPEKVRDAIRSGEIDTSTIERLAGGDQNTGRPLPPRKPRRFFGKDK